MIYIAMAGKQNSTQPFLKHKKLILGIVIITVLIVVGFFLPSKSSLKQDNSTGPNTVAPSPTVVVTLPPKGTYLEDQLIVKYQQGKSPTELSDPAEVQQLRKADIDAGMLQRTRLSPQSTGPLSLYYLIVLKKGSDLKKAMEIYQALPYISEVQVNGIIKAQ